jgi:prepilin-type N-terminal cleavage/methylation domain-containing protein
MSRRGFSMTELLVALGIIAVTAALVVPRFIDVRQRASEAYYQENVKRLNRAFATWEAAGGYVGASAYTSDILKLLGSQPGTVLSFDGGTSGSADDVIDGGAAVGVSGISSSSVRITLPSDLSLPTSGRLNSVNYGNGALTFDASTKTFTYTDLSSATWYPRQMVVLVPELSVPTGTQLPAVPYYVKSGNYWERVTGYRSAGSGVGVDNYYYQKETTKPPVSFTPLSSGSGNSTGGLGFFGL